MLLSERRLKTWLRRSVAWVCSRFGIAWMWRQLLPRQSVRILAYHGIEKDPSNHFSVATHVFEQQIRYLSENYPVVSLGDFAASLSDQRSLASGSVVVTFDDGYRDFLTDAIPVLEKYRVPATCFVIASKLAGDDPRFMSSDEVRSALESELVTIGCHSMTHASIRQAPADQRKIEVGEAKARLETALQRPIVDFCYPYGTKNDFDDESATLIKQSGFRLALTSINGVNTRKTNPFKLRRTKIEAGDDIHTFKNILAGALDVWYLVDNFLYVFQRRRRVMFR